MYKRYTGDEARENWRQAMRDRIERKRKQEGGHREMSREEGEKPKKAHRRKRHRTIYRVQRDARSSYAGVVRRGVGM